MTRRSPHFAEYIALGDSMSIDLYPALDAGETDVAVALEWDARAGKVSPLGAASLLFSNDERFDDFAGRDLASLFPGVTFHNYAEDGATIGDVFGSQLSQVEAADVETLFTLTAGGNDLLSAFANKPDPALLKSFVRDVGDAYEFLADSLRRTRPNSALLLTTVYDPSDGTRKVPGLFDGAGALPIEALHELNDRIRSVARAMPGAIAVDAHQHFLGHGVTANDKERWYWKRHLIEPGLSGANELRRLWLEAVTGDS